METETLPIEPTAAESLTPVPVTGLNAEDDGYAAVLSHRPPWLVQWGISLYFLLLCVVLGIGWFIRYPDRVVTTGRLVAVNAPRSLMVRSEGRLLDLLHQDGDSVEAGNLLAVLENTADYEAVLDVKMLGDSLQAAMMTGNSDAAPAYYQRLQKDNRVRNLGELQTDHQQFVQALQTFTQYLGSGYYLRRRIMLRTDLQTVEAQRKVLQQQLSLTRQDVALAGENYTVSDKLAKQQVIAPVELRNEQSKWLGKQMQIPQLENALVGNETQHNEKQKEIAALENEIAQQKAVFVQALHKWLASLAAWEQQYLLFAPCSGRLILTGFLQQGSTLQRGEIMGSVQPPDAGYYVEANLPQYNFGKLRLGQKALLKFDAYPFEEFGAVDGSLHAIKMLPTDSGYLAKLILPNGLTSSRGKNLHFQAGLRMHVEIITDNRRLLERFFSVVTKSLER